MLLKISGTCIILYMPGAAKLTIAIDNLKVDYIRIYFWGHAHELLIELSNLRDDLKIFKN